MIAFTPRGRRTALVIARGSTLVSAAMLCLAAVSFLGAQPHASAAAINAGPLQVLAARGRPPHDTGRQDADKFDLKPPQAAACAGDSASGGYHIQSYMVQASVDPATLTFDANGPITPNAADVHWPLFAQNTAFVDGNTAIATSSGPSGAITGVPSFDFAAFGADGPQLVPPGTYNVGIACTLNTAPPATQLDRFWNVRMTFVTDQNDQPSHLRWTVEAAPADTTTSTTTAATSTTAKTTTTTSAVTTTTVRGGTTTTVAGTSTTVAGTTTTTIRTQSAAQGQSGSGTSSGSSGGSIPTTGASLLPVVIWGVLLIVFGRMVILLGRPIRVRPPDRR